MTPKSKCRNRGSHGAHLVSLDDAGWTGEHLVLGVTNLRTRSTLVKHWACLETQYTKGWKLATEDTGGIGVQGVQKGGTAEDW